jgi:hypothetical protein
MTSLVTTPSGAGLVANVVRFSRLLRENSISVSSSSLLDAIKALAFIETSWMDAFRDLLRSNLVCRKEDWEKFDGLFQRFFLQQDHLAFPAKAGPAEGQEGASEIEAGKPEHGPSASGQEPPTAGEAAALLYSPHPLYRERDPRDLHFSESRQLAELLARLLRPLAHRPSRRRRYTVHGKEISLRRVLRKNLQFGGELIFLDFKERKIKRKRVVFLCDVSGSMDVHTLMVLQFAHALKRADARTEIFFFSTELSRVTDLFSQVESRAALDRLPSVVSDWGGGTRIGHCLKALSDAYGGRLLSGRPIVMIYSDGWDRGETELLQDQMALLKRRAHKIIWLNPLLRTRDYEPICRGMAVALPYVDYFLPLGHLQDLQRLGRTLQEMTA